LSPQPELEAVFEGVHEFGLDRPSGQVIENRVEGVGLRREHLLATRQVAASGGARLFLQRIDQAG
jgi:hypothetical protein